MKKMIILLINVMFIIVLCGCFGKRDIDQLSISIAIGIDKSDQGFEITAQIVNPNVLGRRPMSQSPVVIVHEEGKTVFEAIRKLSGMTPGRLFFSHFQALLFGEEIAREGIDPYLQFFKADPETQHVFDVFIVKGDTAKNALSVITTLTLIPALSIVQKVQLNQDIYGSVYDSTINKIYNDIRVTGIEPAVSSLEVIGDVKKGSKTDNTTVTDPDALIETAEVAVFKTDKLVGFLTKDESRGYNFIVDNIRSTTLTPTLEDGTKITFEVFKSKTKIKLKLENNIPKFTIENDIKGTIIENMIGKTKDSKAFHDEIAKAISKEVEKLILASISKALKEYNADIFGFGLIIHRKELDYWKQIEKDYDKVLKEIVVDVKVKTIINRIRL
ncbi:MAG: hypothetical protein K0Q49_2505 [Haloplasmataceae bacterium]|jgi:spore germination protein KC|nr:hypothetical protein [Haloplasmataceae bacterium]